MTRRDALVQVIECLHAELHALRTSDAAALEKATQAKLGFIEAVAAADDAEMTPEIRTLAEEAHRLNEATRIHVNLMAANVRRRLQALAGTAGTPYRPNLSAAYA